MLSILAKLFTNTIHLVTKSVIVVSGCLAREKSMATNPPTGDNKRIGAVKKRSQTYNPKTKKWVKRDTETGLFLDQKANDEPFKGVRKEK